jgi:RTX calcium-binding nonapeptide repeat (4 copies)
VVAGLAAAAAVVGAAAGAGTAAQQQRPTCAGMRATIVGSARGDRINGTSRSDVIVSRGGNDRVNGRGGDDRICLGAGNDLADGGPGNDRVLGETGRDVVEGGEGNDRGEGGAGDDVVLGAIVQTGGPPSSPSSDGNDVLSGGPGKDMLFGGTGTNVTTGGPGADGCVNGTGLPEPVPPRVTTAVVQAGDCEGPPVGTPQATRVIATLNVPVTTYRISLFRTEVVAPASFEPLAGTGFGTVPHDLCGTFAAGSISDPAARATWTHPHPPCPNENVHPALISFYGYGRQFRMPRGHPIVTPFRICFVVRYEKGSAAGIGDSPPHYSLCQTR